MAQENSNIKERNKSDIKKPGKYAVIFHNDDFTPMEFVVIVLISIFFKNVEDAEKLMMKVHLEGQAIVGTYYYDIALTKANRTIQFARDNGYPLRVSLRPI